VRTTVKTVILIISITAMTICMELGITVQKWIDILAPFPYPNRVILLGSAGLILICLCVRTGAYTLRSILYEENLQLSNDFKLIGIFSLNGFGFGLLISALTLLIWLM